jgi:hypothetical protein
MVSLCWSEHSTAKPSGKVHDSIIIIFQSWTRMNTKQGMSSLWFDDHPLNFTGQHSECWLVKYLHLNKTFSITKKKKTTNSPVIHQIRACHNVPLYRRKYGKINFLWEIWGGEWTILTTMDRETLWFVVDAWASPNPIHRWLERHNLTVNTRWI